MKGPAMNTPNESANCSRRGFITRLASGVLLCTSAGAFADELMRTPLQTEGPFYPDKLPLDTDNDLVQVNDSTTPAIGDITWLNGRILDSRGEPMRNALVEIWQVDRNGVYLHTGSSSHGKRDTNFQGFG